MSFGDGPGHRGEESTPPEERAMSTYLPYEATATRVDDLVRAAATRHLDTPVRSNHSGPVAIRRAAAADRETLDRLAALDSARKVVGEALIADVDDEPRVAIELVTGRIVADPFRPTVHLVEQLQQRAEKLEEQAVSRRRLRLRPRLATS
jgi:hypothetical protein